MILIHGDYSEVDREFDRLGKVPGAEGRKKLDAVLNLTFNEARGNVHVRTGSLKSSGKKKSGMRGRKTWVGEFSFGGVSTGVNNPVKYAGYEKARGGDHDWMMNVHLADAMYVQAIKGVLRG